MHLTAKERRAHILRGLASWYGKVFNGRRTASGERFDMYAMTACHPTLPFGSVVRVVNETNKRSVVVRITDRGDLGAVGLDQLHLQLLRQTSSNMSYRGRTANLTASERAGREASGL